MRRNNFVKVGVCRGKPLLFLLKHCITRLVLRMMMAVKQVDRITRPSFPLETSGIMEAGGPNTLFIKRNGSLPTPDPDE